MIKFNLKLSAFAFLFLSFTTFIANAQSTAQNKANGHEYVDLGLSVKWATCNVGASSPYEYGYPYAWGEIDNWNQKHVDVAENMWGDGWGTPTNEEVQELCDNCSWEWTTKYGTNGYLISGLNGNTIFLPASGAHYTLSDIGEKGKYWTSTEHPTAYWGGCLCFDKYNAELSWDLIGRLHFIRPVRE